MTLPKDPMILLSYVNTQLRDFYPNLTEFCKVADIETATLKETLKKVDYEYDEETNQFV